MSLQSSRVKWIAGCFLGLIVLSVPTGIVYLQHRLEAAPALPDTSHPWEDPVVAKKLSDAQLVKAKAIRDEWRPWALQHKAQLRALLDSHGKDFPLVLSLYQITPPLIIGDWEPDVLSGSVKFIWYGDEIKWLNGGTHFTPRSKQDILSRKDKIIANRDKNLHEWLAEYSDYVVSESANPGPTTEVWASGRITEKKYVDNPDTTPGALALIVNRKEVVPPFDFLTSSDPQ